MSFQYYFMRKYCYLTLLAKINTILYPFFCPLNKIGIIILKNNKTLFPLKYYLSIFFLKISQFWLRNC